ncbi:hypothetical protein B0H11DRAFT_2292446 [Mycena galericulata]|nr:hypothetical protein B0H11DRAFT_2292446 [Mycena galericulata]
MRFNFLICSTVSFALYAAALPRSDNEKRAGDPYTTYLNKGVTILQDISCSSSDTDGLTAKYNQLYAPFATKSEVDTASGDGQTVVEILEIEPSTSLVQFSIAREGQETAYKNFFDVANGIIVGVDNFNDKFFYVSKSPSSNKANPAKTVDNSLQWNSIVGEQFKTLGGSLANLQHILRFEIKNQGTIDMIEKALDMHPPLPVQNGWTVVEAP